DSLQSVEQLVHLRGGELLVVMAVDEDHRRAAACGHALLLALEEHAPVGRGFAQLAAQLLLGMLDQLVGAVEPAADVGAEGDVVAPDLADDEHRIEAGDLVRPHRRQAEVDGDRGNDLVVQPAAVLLLGGEQPLDHRRTLAVGREPADPVVDRGPGFVAEHDHRVDVARRFVIACRLHRPYLSISPNTMSYVPIIATTSDSMCPLTTAFIEDMCAKPGARRCTRNGLLAPSETR